MFHVEHLSSHRGALCKSQYPDSTAGDSFSCPNGGIHRMEHDPGAITIHVYSPPIRSLGHYDLVDGMLQRTPGEPDDPSPPSADLFAAAEPGAPARE